MTVSTYTKVNGRKSVGEPYNAAKVDGGVQKLPRFFNLLKEWQMKKESVKATFNLLLSNASFLPCPFSLRLMPFSFKTSSVRIGSTAAGHVGQNSSAHGPHSS